MNALILQNPLNASSLLKVMLLKLFGAKIGRGAIIKPGVNIKHPWFLTMGDNCWIGENAWLDNTFAPVTIGSNVCISQGAYLCTGNHDWTDTAFGLRECPLEIADGAWIGAKALVLPGAKIESHVVLAAGSVLSSPTKPYMVYGGNPATEIKPRVMREEPS